MPLVSPVSLFLLVIITLVVADRAGSVVGVKPIRISLDLLYLLAWYALPRVLLPENLAYLLLFVYYPYKVVSFY